MVTISEENLSTFDEVAGALRSGGMRIDGMLREIGIIHGQVAADRLARLRKIPGVADVSMERDVQLPPPSSEIQ